LATLNKLNWLQFAEFGSSGVFFYVQLPHQSSRALRGKHRWYHIWVRASSAETIFGRGGGGKTGLIEFEQRFCPRNKRSLKKGGVGFSGFGPLICPRNKQKKEKVFAGFGPRSCPRSKCSLKRKKVFADFRLRFFGSEYSS